MWILAKAAILCLASFTLSTWAECYDIYRNPRQGCTFNFDNPDAIFVYAVKTGPGPNWDVGVGNCGADHGFTFVCSFQLVSGQSTTQTVTWRDAPSVPETLTLPFSNVPAASIVPNSPVSCLVEAGLAPEPGFSWGETFVLTKNPIPVNVDSTVTIPTAATTTTTSTSTLVDATETTITPDTVTATVATGTKTVIGKPTLSTQTITITPHERTTRKVVVSYTTTTLSCLSQHRKRHRGERYAAGNEIFQRDVGSETPTCYAPIVTPTIVNTILSTVTVTTETSVDLAFSTTTSTSTFTAAAPTSIVNVKATVTRTPTFTRYKWTVVKPSTVTKTDSVTKTVTKLPKTRLTVCGSKPTGTPQQCKNSVVKDKNGFRQVKCQ